MVRYCLLWLMFLAGYMARAQNPQSLTDWASLEKYKAQNQLLMAAPENDRRVVFMGNSITEFWQYADDFFSSHGYINRGISGQTSPQMLVRFRPDVIALKPAVVVIMAGINDIAENTGPISLEDVMGNITSMAELARANDIQVILCSVLPALDFNWRPGLQPAEKIIRLNALIKNYCHEHSIFYLDYYSKMVNKEKGMDSAYADDGVHPNLSGYKVMEPLVQSAIEHVLKR